MTLWYSFPLIVSISMVYAATRHESMPAILSHAFRVALWIIAFMAILMGILWLVTPSN